MQNEVITVLGNDLELTFIASTLDVLVAKRTKQILASDSGASSYCANSVEWDKINSQKPTKYTVSETALIWSSADKGIGMFMP